MHGFHTLEALVAERRSVLASNAARHRLARRARRVRRLSPQPPRHHGT